VARARKCPRVRSHSSERSSPPARLFHAWRSASFARLSDSSACLAVARARLRGSIIPSDLTLASRGRKVRETGVSQLREAVSVSRRTKHVDPRGPPSAGSTGRRQGCSPRRRARLAPRGQPPRLRCPAALGPIAIVVAAAFRGNFRVGTLLSLFLLAERGFLGADRLVALTLDVETVRRASGRCFGPIDAGAAVPETLSV
jgi:hypothetical protein